MKLLLEKLEYSLKFYKLKCAYQNDIVSLKREISKKSISTEILKFERLIQKLEAVKTHTISIKNKICGCDNSNCFIYPSENESKLEMNDLKTHLKKELNKIQGKFEHKNEETKNKSNKSKKISSLKSKIDKLETLNDFDGIRKTEKEKNQEELRKLLKENQDLNERINEITQKEFFFKNKIEKQKNKILQLKYMKQKIKKEYKVSKNNSKEADENAKKISLRKIESGEFEINQKEGNINEQKIEQKKYIRKDIFKTFSDFSHKIEKLNSFCLLKSEGKIKIAEKNKEIFGIFNNFNELINKKLVFLAIKNKNIQLDLKSKSNDDKTEKPESKLSKIEIGVLDLKSECDKNLKNLQQKYSIIFDKSSDKRLEYYKNIEMQKDEAKDELLGLLFSKMKWMGTVIKKQMDDKQNFSANTPLENKKNIISVELLNFKKNILDYQTVFMEKIVTRIYGISQMSNINMDNSFKSKIKRSIRKLKKYDNPEIIKLVVNLGISLKYVDESILLKEAFQKFHLWKKSKKYTKVNKTKSRALK